MDSCCKILDLGTYGHCDEVVLEILANKTDIYQLEYNFLGSIVRKSTAVMAGTNIKLKGEWFNETAQVSLKIFDSKGVALTISQLDNDSGQVCESYEEFKIKFSQRIGLDRPLSDCCYCA